MLLEYFLLADLALRPCKAIPCWHHGGEILRKITFQIPCLSSSSLVPPLFYPLFEGDPKMLYERVCNKK
jgi:hypothetical protein